nr:hypothetical protein [Tanacetum cinerariifolium]
MIFVWYASSTNWGHPHIYPYLFSNEFSICGNGFTYIRYDVRLSFDSNFVRVEHVRNKILQGIPTASYGDPLAITLCHCKGPTSESSARKKGRTVAITTKDMQKRRNDVKKRTTLLLALPDEYQLRFSKKNTENLNTKISKLNEELSDCKTDLYNYKRGLSQAEARLVEFKENEVKFCERIRVLERDVEIRDNKIEYLKNEIEHVKKEKESLDNKLTGFGLPEFVDDTVTDYSRPTPSIDTSKCNKSELQSGNFSIFEHGESTGSIMSKPMIKFVKEVDCPRVIKTNNTENARKSTVKYAEMYRNISKDNGETWPKDNYTHKSMTPRAILHKPGITPRVGNLHNNINDKGYWNSGCSWHMTGNISYLSEYEPYDGGYVSFGHGGGKITGKGIINTGKLKFENVYFVKELKYNLFSVS